MDSEDTNVGFVPSFLDNTSKTSSRPKRVRNRDAKSGFTTSTSASAGSGAGSSLDELDRMMGLPVLSNDRPKSTTLDSSAQSGHVSFTFDDDHVNSQRIAPHAPAKLNECLHDNSFTKSKVIQSVLDPPELLLSPHPPLTSSSGKSPASQFRHIIQASIVETEASFDNIDSFAMSELLPHGKTIASPKFSSAPSKDIPNNADNDSLNVNSDSMANNYPLNNANNSSSSYDENIIFPTQTRRDGSTPALQSSLSLPSALPSQIHSLNDISLTAASNDKSDQQQETYTVGPPRLSLSRAASCPPLSLRNPTDIEVVHAGAVHFSGAGTHANIDTTPPSNTPFSSPRGLDAENPLGFRKPSSNYESPTRSTVGDPVGLKTSSWNGSAESSESRDTQGIRTYARSQILSGRPVIESAHSGDQGGSQGGIQAGFVSASEIEVMKVQLTKSFVEISSLRDQLTALKLTALRCHDLEKEVKAAEMHIQVVNAEVMDLKNKVTLYEAEITSLKQAAANDTVRHSEEIARNKENYENEFKSLNSKHLEDIKSLDLKHRESELALKKLHGDEIASANQQIKQGAMLEHMSDQIKTTSGSIKLIEEQLNVRYKGVEAARQGQMEARERLLVEMEERAKDRSEAAEAETFRLKGIIVHLETVVSGLRTQTAEEKERLRHEHQRAHSLQLSLEIERQSFHKLASEEMDALRAKEQQFHADKSTWNQERQKQLQELESLKRSISHEQQKIAADLEANKAIMESHVLKLREEEKSLLNIRQENLNESKIVDAKKLNLHRELQDAATLRAAAAQAREQSQRDREALDKMARELREASDRLHQETLQINDKEDLLDKRELELETKLNSIAESSENLKHREQELVGMIKDLEKKLVFFEKEEKKLTEKRLEIASAYREWLAIKANESKASVYSAPRAAPSSTLRQSWSGPLPSYTPSSYQVNTAMSPPKSQYRLPLHRQLVQPSIHAKAGEIKWYDQDVNGAQLLPNQDVDSPISTSSTWLASFERKLSRTSGAAILRMTSSYPGTPLYELKKAQSVLNDLDAIYRHQQYSTIQQT